MKNPVLIALVAALITASPCSAKSLAIHADVVSEAGAQKSWIVVDQSTGKITSITKTDKSIPLDSIKLEFNGYAYPGLIDTHNHLVWNSIKAWTPDQVYNNRFEWNLKKEGPYWDEVAGVYEDLKKDTDKVQREKTLTNSSKYGEIRAIVGGTTMIESSYSKNPSPPSILARNLNLEFHAHNDTNGVEGIDFKDYKARLKDTKTENRLNRLFLHVAEGKRGDKQGLKEFDFLKTNHLLNPKVVIIHGSSLTKTEFQQMAKKKMGMSWSPRSNVALYKETTAIPDAIDAGVTVALSPDWTISGSNNSLEEMKFAFEYAKQNWSANNPITPKRLYSMVTTDAAKVAGIQKQFGKLQKNFYGDFFLASTLDADPFVSLLKTTPRDIALVVVGGNPVYGNDKEMKEIGTDSVSEPIEIEGVNKRIIVKDGTDANKDDVSAIKSDLTRMIKNHLAPIVEQH